MVGTASSSSSSTSSTSASISSLDDVSARVASPAATVKFLCSYGGKILPRYPDGRLRYVGGDTRVLAVDHSITFSELQMKLRAMCGWVEVNVRCQLPAEDLDALVSVTSDEDLANLIDEYASRSADRGSSSTSSPVAARLLPLKIRAFLLPPPSSKPASTRSPTAATPLSAVDRCVHQAATRCITSRYERPAAAAGEVRFHGHLNHQYGHHHRHVHHHGRHRQ